MSTLLTEVCKRFEFAAHHKLPFHNGKCAHDHGHNYVLTLCVAGYPLHEDKISRERGDAGMVLDFQVLSVIWRTLEPQLDHKSLNDLLENPTAEQLLGWLVPRVQRALETYNQQRGTLCILSRVRLEETSDSFAEWRGLYGGDLLHG